MSETTPRRQVEARAHRPTRLQVDEERLELMWTLEPEQRLAAARAGQLTLGEMLRWAARAPHEVPLVDGEFFFITALSAERED